MESSSAHAATYWQYLQRLCFPISETLACQITQLLAETNWEEPQSPLDYNHCAVIALIEAEQCEEPTLRQMYLELALNALNQSVEEHPLCLAHLAVVRNLINPCLTSIESVWPVYLKLLDSADPRIQAAPGLVYLPSFWQLGWEPHNQTLKDCLSAEDGNRQALWLLAEILWRSQAVFFNEFGKQVLQSVHDVLPTSAAVQLNLGIAHLMEGELAGLALLQQANQCQPSCASIVQALYLAYRAGGQPQSAEVWRSLGQQASQSHSQSLTWYWSQIDPNSPWTYVLYDDLLLAVEPSFCSIVTSVLLARGDWFEQEMGFWRDRLQPGMVVIDVGANVGVYTFSAAQRVGATGRVLAIEPLSNCARTLEETCRINQLSQVRVCQGAASDRDGTAHLRINLSSELNALQSGDLFEESSSHPYEEVACFKLDSLIEREQLDRVDLIKIDAEGHELAVLSGSQQILERFQPIVLYENMVGDGKVNVPVAEFLIRQGYQLFAYQPYLKQLLEIESLQHLSNQLNVIALPA